ncbi:hypothetical protein SynSYN20_01001 [Synechococcus sp. SYN20]|uniref:hypothetical protein n=1 Tax=Synechococcus sp. SYN20 TaxID=1050714 RepID=UPI001649751E|nr:hypothetical protein [Synechococcus sp. SYN20]QNJ25339.1 hypothetical protein SynSYN20_01001 [Synechococcus sp. SYN20]
MNEDQKGIEQGIKDRLIDSQQQRIYQYQTNRSKTKDQSNRDAFSAQQKQEWQLLRKLGSSIQNSN